MPNEYYYAAGVPADGSRANSSPIRAEFDLIETGMNKLPAIVGHGGQGVSVNGAADGIESISDTTYNSRIGSLDSTKKDVADGYAGLTLLKINIMNAIGTIASFFTNSNTASRTYTFPDSDGTVLIKENTLNWARRNVIINGGFNVWQRATTQVDIDGYYSDDRWLNGRWQSLATHTRENFANGQTDVPGNPKFFSRTVVASSPGIDHYCLKEQKIENVETLSGGMATLTFWAKSDAIRNMAIELYQFFGTGGVVPSDTVYGIGSQKISLTASWQKFTLSIDIPSVSGKIKGNTFDEWNGNDYLSLVFWFDAGGDFDSRTASLGQQSGTFDIANVQLEKGSSASEFELYSPQTELKMCQRYYQTVEVLFSGKVTSGQTYRMITDLPVMPRVYNYGRDTLSSSDINFGTTSSIGAWTHFYYFTAVANGSGMGQYRSTIYIDAELEN